MMKKEALKTGILNALHGVDPKTATPQQLHQALGETVMEAIAPDWKKRSICSGIIWNWQSHSFPIRKNGFPI